MTRRQWLALARAKAERPLPAPQPLFIEGVWRDNVWDEFLVFYYCIRAYGPEEDD